MTRPKRAIQDWLDVPLPAGRVLRLVLHREEEGEDELLIVAGHPSRGWTRIMAEGVNVPAESLPEVVQAIRLLNSEEVRNG